MKRVRRRPNQLKRARELVRDLSVKLAEAEDVIRFYAADPPGVPGLLHHTTKRAKAYLEKRKGETATFSA